MIFRARVSCGLGLISATVSGVKIEDEGTGYILAEKFSDIVHKMKSVPDTAIKIRGESFSNSDSTKAFKNNYKI